MALNSAVVRLGVGVRPDTPAGLSKPLESEPGRVDRAGSGVDEQIIQESAEGAAKEWGNHGNLESESKSATWSLGVIKGEQVGAEGGGGGCCRTQK